MPSAQASSPCTTVGTGGVGESGSSRVLIHEVTGKLEIVMVLRTTETSLCPNTGAYAVLLVNGQPQAHGMITEDGSSIQANARPGDQVVALVHTVPLLNEIQCIRLGELSFRLDQCDLVS